MKKLLLNLARLLPLLIVAACLHAVPAHAYTNSNLIDNAVFDNVNSMSAGQIQTFLNQFPNSCLKNYQAPDPQSWSGYGGNVSAAQAIYDAAHIWGINPQVLLTTMEKEEGLVGGAGAYGCSATAYWSAMGYDCPGSATYSYPDIGVSNTCVAHESNVGFSAQINHGGWQLEFGRYRSEGNGNLGWDGDDAITYYGYMTQGSRARYQGGPVNFYSGSITLNDGTTLTVANGATAALYSYTPYIQSFSRIFEGFFGIGSTSAFPYQWQYGGQASSTSLNGVLPGQTATLTVSAVNSGVSTWTNSGSNPVDLGTSHPQDRSSAFATSGWLGSSRPTRLNEASVAPGQTGTFTFTLQIPNSPGHYQEYFNLVAEGVTWMNDPGLYFDITVAQPTYSWSLSSQAAYTDSSKSANIDLTTLSPGQKAWLQLKAVNTGNLSWSNTGSNPVDLGTTSPADRASGFIAPGWMGPNRAARLIETSVLPGAVGTFEFPITATAGGGTYFERFNLVAEGVAWMNDIGLGYYIKVTSGYSWSLVSQYAFTDSTKTTPMDLTQLSAGQTVLVGFTARNTGTSTWYNSGSYPIDVSTTSPIDRCSAFTSVGWIACQRPARLKETSVAPGQVGTFEFSYTAPTTTGIYNEHFGLVAEGITHLNDIGLAFYTQVK